VLSWRHPNAASTSWFAALIQAVMSASSACPEVAAAVHSPRIVGSECRIPRRSRGWCCKDDWVIAAKHPSNPPAPARASTAGPTLTRPDQPRVGQTATDQQERLGASPWLAAATIAGPCDGAVLGLVLQFRIVAA